MSGSIIQFAYGILLDIDAIEDERTANTVYKFLQEQRGYNGIHGLYDAYGDRPYHLVFGVLINDISEGNTGSLDSLIDSAEVTEAHKEEFKQLWSDLDDDTRDVIELHWHSSPRSFYMWYNS